MSKPTDLVQGTLDLLILKIVALEPQHGWGIAQRIKQISNEITIFRLTNRRYPASLQEIGMDGKLDPWGRPYQYLLIAGTKDKKGFQRKDKNLVPLNSDYDLYSLGRDGGSSPPITALNSHDDIVRANNGGFVGLATNY